MGRHLPLWACFLALPLSHHQPAHSCPPSVCVFLCSTGSPPPPVGPRWGAACLSACSGLSLQCITLQVRELSAHGHGLFYGIYLDISRWLAYFLILKTHCKQLWEDSTKWKQKRTDESLVQTTGSRVSQAAVLFQEESALTWGFELRLKSQIR